MTAEQIKLVRWLMSKAELSSFKEDLVYAHSNCRTISLKEMTYDETMSLVEYLRSYAGEPEGGESRMRRKILSMAHELKWKLKNGAIDMDRVNAWCVKYGHCHKPLDAYSYDELPALVTQFENAYRDYLKGF